VETGPCVGALGRSRICILALGALALGACDTAHDSQKRGGTTGAIQHSVELGAFQWGEQQRLPAPAPGLATSFGTNVAVTEDYLFVSSSFETHVYSLDGAEWKHESALQPTQTTVSSLSARGETVAVGAQDEVAGDLSVTGVVYASLRVGTSWPTTAERLEGEADGDRFGHSVAVGTELLVVGAPARDELAEDAGAVYVYTRTEAGWDEPQKLLPPDVATSAFGSFGAAVAVSSTDDTIIVGAPNDGTYGDLAGTAYVFRRDGSEWTRTVLSRDAPGDYDIFGVSVAVEGTTALVGAWGRSENGPEAGAAYVFTEVGAEWSQEAKLMPTELVESDQFGYRVALGPDVALVGVPYRAPNGAAYLFTRAATEWTARPPIDLGDEGVEERFGLSVALVGTMGLIGSPSTSDVFGAVYTLAIQDGARCSANSDCVSWNCVEGVCCNEPCTGACQSCLALQKGAGVDGQCGAMAEHALPRSNECDVDPGNPCGATGSCNGQGDCAFRPEGTVCGPPSCQDGAAASLACDGQGQCGSFTRTCQLYQCLTGNCLEGCTADVHCQEQAFCDDAGVCVPKTALGVACSSGRECVSGHCADGVCCDDACEGLCESCAQEKFEGSCVPIRGAPRGERPSCPQGSEDDPCRAAQCDGETTSACLEYAGPQVSCDVAGCDGTDATERGTCDGSGSCQCPAGPRCNADRSAVVEEDGSETDCSPFSCQVNICLERCEVDDDCVRGLDCNPTNQKCEVVQAGNDSDAGGCSLARPAGLKRNGVAVPLLLLIASVSGRRLARRKKMEGRPGTVGAGSPNDDEENCV
jgi:hypothetical protein